MADTATDHRGLMSTCLPLLLALAGCKAASGAMGPPPGNQPPQVRITQPSAGTSISAGDTLVLAGTASDPEDGTLTGASLAWSSSRDGALGSGDSLVVSTLT